MAEFQRASGDATSARDIVWRATEADIPRILDIAKGVYTQWIGVPETTLQTWAQSAIAAPHVGLYTSANGFAFGLLQPGPDLMVHARLSVIAVRDGELFEPLFLAKAVVDWAVASHAADIYWDVHPSMQVDPGPIARKLGFTTLPGYIKELKSEWCC